MPDRTTDLWPLLRAELQHLLDESLRRVTHCVAQLSDEQIWWHPGAGQNSIGNLLLHVEGNLRQWAVSGLTNAADRRDRASEFLADGGISAAELRDKLAMVISEVSEILRTIDPEQLSDEIAVQGFCVTQLGALMHTVPHLVGHTHQITQLTRLQLGNDYTMQWSPNDARDRVPL